MKIFYKNFYLILFLISISHIQAQNISEKLVFDQIPTEILLTMTTAELVQAFYEYDHKIWFFAYNTAQEGFNRLCSDFNGVKELLNRKDAGTEILKFYEKLNVNGIETDWDLNTKGKYVLEFIYFEVLLSQKEIVETLSSTQKKELLVVLLNKFEQKEEYIDLYSEPGLNYNAYPMAYLLDDLDNSLTKKEINAERKFFMQTGRLINVNTIRDIIEDSKNVISK